MCADSNTPRIFTTLKRRFASFRSGREPDIDPQQRGVWPRQAEFVLSSLGFMVGMGNVMRFPYNVYMNGGSAFLVIYFVCVLLLGLPLVYLQLCLGQYSGMSTSVVFGKMSPIFSGVGWAFILVTIPLCVYYNMLLAWSLYYLTQSLRDPLPWTYCQPDWNFTCHNSSSLNKNISANYTSTSAYLYFYKHVVNSKTTEMGSLQPHLVFCLFVAWFLTFLCAFKGVRSIGKAVYFTATFPYVVLFILLLRGVNLEDGWDTGVVKHYLSWNSTPFYSFSGVFDVSVKAAQQVFYSLSTDVAALITMSSYSSFHNNAYRDSIILVTADTLTSYLAGLVFFSFIGFLASQLGITPCQVFGEKGSEIGIAIAFITYSDGISRMDYANLWAILFFSMLVMAALDCEFAWIEQLTATVMEQFGIREKYMPVVVGTICSLLFCAGLVQCTQAGIHINRVIDEYATLINVFILGFLQMLIVSYLYGHDEMMKDIHCMVGWRYKCNPQKSKPGHNEDDQPSRFMKWFGPTGKYFELSWKFTVPIILAVFTVMSVFMYVSDEDASVAFDHSSFIQWQQVAGWLIAMFPLLALPICAIHKICTNKHRSWSQLLKGSKNLDETPGKKNMRTKYMLTTSTHDLRPQLSKLSSGSMQSGHIPGTLLSHTYPSGALLNAAYVTDDYNLHQRKGAQIQMQQLSPPSLTVTAVLEQEESIGSCSSTIRARRSLDD